MLQTDPTTASIHDAEAEDRFLQGLGLRTGFNPALKLDQTPAKRMEAADGFHFLFQAGARVLKPDSHDDLRRGGIYRIRRVR